MLSGLFFSRSRKGGTLAQKNPSRASPHLTAYWPELTDRPTASSLWERVLRTKTNLFHSPGPGEGPPSSDLLLLISEKSGTVLARNSIGKAAESAASGAGYERSH